MKLLSLFHPKGQRKEERDGVGEVGGKLTEKSKNMFSGLPIQTWLD